CCDCVCEASFCSGNSGARPGGAKGQRRPNGGIQQEFLPGNSIVGGRRHTAQPGRGSATSKTQEDRRRRLRGLPARPAGKRARGNMTIPNVSKWLAMIGAVLVFAGVGIADTLELKDGRVLQGKYLGGTQAVLRFQVNREVQTFPTNDIVALTFTRSSGGPPPAAAPAA